MKKNPALHIIEEVYEIAMNPTLDYLAQLQPVAPSGELADKVKLTAIVFKLCEQLDKQAKDIESLKQDREQIASQMAEILASQSVKNSKPIEVGATKPI